MLLRSRRVNKSYAGKAAEKRVAAKKETFFGGRPREAADCARARGSCGQCRGRS